MWAKVLDLCDRAIPREPRRQRLVQADAPDVVLVTPHLMPSSTDAQYARSAAAAGVPTAVCIASWDNLSSKQLLRFVPDLLTVWNDLQKQEAVTIHGVPGDRVVSTGAQCFDHWFGWPPRPREEFCARVGLDPAKPYVLYVGGSLFPSTMTEAEYCLEWIKAVRTSDEPALREAGILIRPHPHRNDEWRRVDFSAFEDVAVWPLDRRDAGRGGHAGRLLRLDLPQCRRLRHQHERDDRGRDHRQGRAHDQRPAVRRLAGRRPPLPLPARGGRRARPGLGDARGERRAARRT